MNTDFDNDIVTLNLSRRERDIRLQIYNFVGFKLGFIIIFF